MTKPTNDWWLIDLFYWLDQWGRPAVAGLAIAAFFAMVCYLAVVAK